MAHDFGIQSQRTTTSTEDASAHQHPSSTSDWVAMSGRGDVAALFQLAVAHADRRHAIRELNQLATQGRHEFIAEYGPIDFDRRFYQEPEPRRYHLLATQALRSFLLQAVLVRTICETVMARLPAELRGIIWAHILKMEGPTGWDDWFVVDEPRTQQPYEEVLVLPCGKGPCLGRDWLMPMWYCADYSPCWPVSQRQLMGEDAHYEYVRWWFSHGRFSFDKPGAVPGFLYYDPFGYNLRPSTLVSQIRVGVLLQHNMEEPFDCYDFKALVCLGAITTPGILRIIRVLITIGSITVEEEKVRAVVFRNFVVALWNEWVARVPFDLSVDDILIQQDLMDLVVEKSVWRKVIGRDLCLREGVSIRELMKSVKRVEQVEALELGKKA